MSQKISGTLPDSLRHFDSLPDSASVRQPTVQALLACSPSTVWRYVHSGKLPQPIKLSERVTVWAVGPLRTALAAMRKAA